MPKKGYVSVTLRADLAMRLRALARESGLGLNELLAWLLRCRPPAPTTRVQIPAAAPKSPKVSPIFIFIVDEIVENRKSKRELIEMGYPREVIEDIYMRFIRRAKYKRRQAPYVKITPKAFGIGWKMPIINHREG